MTSNLVSRGGVEEWGSGLKASVTCILLMAAAGRSVGGYRFSLSLSGVTALLPCRFDGIE